MSWAAWIGLGLFVIALFNAFKRLPKSSTTISNEAINIENLSQDEKFEFAEAIREQAQLGYDRASKAAKLEGKSDAFCHEVGILDAGFAVLANDNSSRQSKSIREYLQMEMMPFSVGDPLNTVLAAKEYLVYKHIPELSSESLIENGMRDFVNNVFVDAKSQSDPDSIIYSFIYSGKYDWQKFAQNIARECN